MDLKELEDGHKILTLVGILCIAGRLKFYRSVGIYLLNGVLLFIVKVSFSLVSERKFIYL